MKFLPVIFLFYISQTVALSPDTLFSVKDSSKTDSSIVSNITDTLQVNDSTFVRDSIAVADTIVPVQGRPLTDVSQIINKRTFLFYNYRYSGDFLRSFSLNFVKDLAFVGQPNETFLYGVGSGGVSYFEDGVLWNSRGTNSLDLNYIQSEDVDSIEIIPSPRGFLYGPYNNPVSVNFIMKDFLSKVPYSRIQYYQGPFGEAMVDGKFNARIFRRWNLSFQLTNRSANDRYKNSMYGIWQANIKLKYFLSNAVNLTALYSYVDSDVGLNGGVDVESIGETTSDVNSVLYNEIKAPVVFPNRTRSVINHNAGLRVQAVPFDNSYSEMNFYYKFYKGEINDPTDTLDLYSKDINKTLGVKLRHDQQIGIFGLSLLGYYENYKGDNDDYLLPPPFASSSHLEKNIFSIAAVLSANLFDGTLIPSVFYKYQNYKDDFKWSISDTLYSNNTKGFSGIGADLKFKIHNLFSFYAGASVFQHKGFLLNGVNEDTKTLEIGGRFSGKDLFIDLKFFKREGSAAIPQYNIRYLPVVYGNFSGSGLLLNYKFWKILIETNTSYYFNSEEEQLLGVPEFQSISGVYLNGYFFDDNLWLKAGFIFTYTGRTNIYSDVWRNVISVDPSNKIDFSVAGEIQKVAMVYFIWENLLNNEYFITPYYPMPGSSMRFGLSWELFN